MIGPENVRHLLNQSGAKLKTIALGLGLGLGHALSSLLVFALSSHWLTMMYIFVLIGRWDYFGFGFSDTMENCSISFFNH